MTTQAGVISKNPSLFFSMQQSLAPAARTANATGTAIDRYANGGYGALCLILNVGAWTDGTHAFVIEESDDNSTWTTVAAADLLTNPKGGSGFASITSSPTNVIQKIDYIGRLRYVRVRAVVSGTTTGAIYAVTGHLFAPTIYPAVQP